VFLKVFFSISFSGTPVKQFANPEMALGSEAKLPGLSGAYSGSQQEPIFGTAFVQWNRAGFV